MKIAVFWVVAPCRSLPTFQRCLMPPSTGRRVIALMMGAASTSETSVNFYQTIRRKNPVDSHLMTNVDPALRFVSILEP
jgi:hypothetical protein